MDINILFDTGGIVVEFKMERLEVVAAPVKVNWGRIGGYAVGYGTKWYICENTGVCW